MPLMQTFDALVCDESRPRRQESVTSLQALAMYNSDFVNEEAEHFAKRVRKIAGDDVEKQIETAFALALGRRPTSQETERVGRLFLPPDSEVENVEALKKTPDRISASISTDDAISADDAVSTVVAISADDPLPVDGPLPATPGYGVVSRPLHSSDRRSPESPTNSQIGRPSVESVDRSGDRPTTVNRPTTCLLYTSPSPRDATLSRMPSSA